MVGKKFFLGGLFLVFLCLTTEGKMKTFRGFKMSGKYGRDIMLSDDPLFSVEEVPGRKSSGTEKGTCSCKCCEEPPAKLVAPPCLNDVIVAVDSSACFRDHHRRMIQFLQKLVNEFHKSGGDAQFGEEKTRLSILQFSSKIKTPILLDDFNNYRDPSQSKRLKSEIVQKVGSLGFLGEGAFLNLALDASLNEFFARPRPKDVSEGRKVVIVLTNGKSHPNVTYEDLDNSISRLRAFNVTVLPVSVTRQCYGVSSPEWDEGLCPDVEALKKLSKLSTYDDDDFLAMRASGTVQTVVKEATDCHYTPPERLVDLCNNCTCECDLPIGPQGDKGDPGPQGESIQGDRGDQGPKGEKGEDGIEGPQGITGEKGRKGDLGPVGDKGDIGPEGAQGVQGNTGEKGRKGDIGDIGPEGEKGDVGDKGEVGDKGDRGQKGDTGDQGRNGIKGDVGEQGDKGDTGRPGIDGIGIKGDEGERGPKGIKGSEGEVGDDGTKGDKGMQGLCGKPGPAGPQGIDGLAGIDGQDGAEGPRGSQGPRGPEGIAGEKGERGNAGADGADGRMGPPGPQGPQGPQGERGIPGQDGRDSLVAGPQGPEGPPGRVGERGEPGRDGLNGLEGTQGKQGPRGPPGQKGSSGKIDLEALKPLLVDIIRDLLPGECVSGPGDVTEGCTEFPIDLVFLIDGSDSIDRDDFSDVQNWILRTVDRFNPMDRDQKLHLDVVQFSEDVKTEVHSVIHESSEEVREIVESINQMRSGTKTYTGLRYVNSNVSSGTRHQSYKILVTMTDGDASEDRDQTAIDTAREFYNQMICVGIGDKIDKDELEDFAHEGRVITVEEFRALEGIIDQIVEESCAKIREGATRSTEVNRRRKRFVEHGRQNRHHHGKKPAVAPITEG